ncbi:MAG: HAD-IC family P-type ATPase, partial [Planctomycetes bacterium]|nr:HAD-IC family P-type ATPase [Planctomycetota bacterium]
MDINVTYPVPGQIHFQSDTLFANTSSPLCQEFVRRMLRSLAVTGITIKSKQVAAGRRPGNGSAIAEVHYSLKNKTRRQVVDELYSQLLQGDQEKFYYNSTAGNGAVANPAQVGQGEGRQSAPPAGAPLRPLTLVPDPDGIVRLYRHGPLVTSWQIQNETPKTMRLYHPSLHRRKEVCQAIERELMSVLGIDSYKTSAFNATVDIKYTPKKIRREQIIEILDSAMSHIEVPAKKDKIDLSFPLCVASVPLAAAAQYAVPALMPVSMALFAYTAIPSFKGSYHVVFQEKRLGVDVLDTIVVVACLSTGAVFAGSVLCLCLGIGRKLFEKTQDDSKKMLMSVFGKAPRFVWLVKDGVEIETPLERLQKGDIIVVKTGEVVPVDGFVKEGMAMIDQHALTGESTPAEKAVGDRVFASTLMVAGKAFIEVESSGGDTTSAKISKILNDAAGYKLASQHKGERLADRAVIPTLAIAGTALATIGPAGAVAVLNSDFGTGIRMAAPLGMLTSLTVCAHKGILVKDGRALELMNEIDTVLFDKTGTLTREVPEVGRILPCHGHSADQVLAYAAAAENKFAHPIAKAILEKFEKSGLDMPQSDDSKYQVGYGITVHIDGHVVRVGSARFVKMEGIEIPPEIQTALDQAHHEGHTLVMVGIDDHLGGALELHASERPEAREIIAGLRKRGVKHIAIISGDHEGPTKKLAERLGMDIYFAGVLPADKASYVEKLQNEGKKVCFVGDG